MVYKSLVVLLVPFLLTGSPLQARAEPERDPALGSVEWRCIGPARGGRSTAIAGVVGDRETYYFGNTGGGVWKTTDAGGHWTNITDGQIGTGSVGAIAVAESDPNVIFVGMGEACPRGNFSHGDGVYRSLDAGKTWEHVGLDDTRQIGAIEIHPRDPDLVYIAALGHVYGPNEQRGVYRSTDGGDSWERILFVDENTGAVDFALDPQNPRVMYAGMWQVRRSPWGFSSGGPGSGLYRSTDAGETWEELTDGLPKGIKGKIGVAPSPAQRDLVYAIIEADDGGLFRSTDGGDSWNRVSEDRELRQRAWYYSHVTADPVDPDTVFVMNVSFLKSIDGGKNFKPMGVPHGDNHGLWIDPQDNTRLFNCNDGGANVSFDGGRSWSAQDRQPTAQFYHVTVDDRVPYRVYGAQQDNSTASVSSRAPAVGNWKRDLRPVGGGESGYIAVDPRDPEIVYAGSYDGFLTRYDGHLRKSRNIMVWPEVPMGAGAEDLVHRFQWTFPIVLSPHDPDTIYVGGERVFRSRDAGGTWESFSPDLTTNDKSKQVSSGGPITKDNTSVEYYCTVFTIAESPIEPGLIWVGTDDGLIQITEDGGEHWKNVTPAGMGDWPLVSLIEASPHDADTAYAAVNRYKSDDFTPMVYRTQDRGRSWQLVADGIDDGAFVRAVREDPARPGLLYAGTETGVFYSLDAGDSWHPLQLDLPRTPITDLVVKNDDLVLSTQGRSFWILDDLEVIRQMDTGGATSDEARLFKPAPAYRQGWDGVRTHFNIPEDVSGDMSLVYLDREGAELRRFKITLKPDDTEQADEGDDETAEIAEPDEAEEIEETADLTDEDKSETIEVEPGMNLHVWDERLPGPVKVPGAVAWPPHPPGPRVAPGSYRVELRLGDQTLSQGFEILPHPGVPTTQAQYDEQFELLKRIDTDLSRAHAAVNSVRTARAQIDAVMKLAREAGVEDSLKQSAADIKRALSDAEEALIQTRSKARQDPLNFPIKLNDKMGGLAYTVDGDYPVTAAARAVYRTLHEQIMLYASEVDRIMNEEIPAFNGLVREAHVPMVTGNED
jgi:photosystem II stability/assembly factor-like uncharacterized protein